MEIKQEPYQFHQDYLHVTVKTEPPEEEEPDLSPFCYETAIKEEVAHEDEEEEEDLADQSECETAFPVEICSTRPFQCSECSRTFDKLYNLNRCAKRHEAIRLQLFKCKVCGKCSSSKRDNAKHESIHRDDTNQSQSVEDTEGTEQGKSGEHAPQKEDRTVECIKKEDVIVKQEPGTADESSDVCLPGSSTEIKTEIEKDKDGLFKCSLCNKSHDQLAYLQRCELGCNAIKLESYKCKTCGKCFPSKANLTRHENNHKKGDLERLNQCKFCDMRLSTPSNLKRHELRHHSNTEPSQSVEAIIPESIQDVSLAPGGVEETSKERPFKCAVCNQTYDQITYAYKCKWKHKVLESERFKCKECGKCFASKHHLTKHENAHGLLKCPDCNQTYKTQRLVTQCSNKHLKQKLGLHQCKLCNWRAGSQHELSKHELTHQLATEPEPEPTDQPISFQCDICKKCFGTKRGIRKHVKCHIKTEPRFECHKCNEIFPTLGERISHSQRHDWDETKHTYFAKLVKVGDGNHLCTICNKKYTNQSLAIAHVFKHMNKIEGLFECEMCGMKCRDKNGYNKHIQIHRKVADEPDATHEIPIPQAAESYDNEGIPMDENSSSFCYEIVFKEELIIEDNNTTGE